MSLCKELRRGGTRTEFLEYELFRGLWMADNAFDIQVGRRAEMVLRDPGEVLNENKVARTYHRRADFEQWGFSEGCPGCGNLRIVRKKDNDQMEFLCELYEAQVARGRYFVHDLKSEVNSRMRCMAKVMAAPGIKTAVADLCMFGLVACDKGGPGFVSVSVRTITNARRVGLRLQSKCRSRHRDAQVIADDTFEKGELTRSRVRQVAQAMKEQLKEDQQELETRATCKRLVHHDEHELLSVREGWHWDDNQGGWLDPELCAGHKMYTRVLRNLLT